MFIIIVLLHFRLFIYILVNPYHLYYLPPHKSKSNIWCVPACWSEELMKEIWGEGTNHSPLSCLGEVT